MKRQLIYHTHVNTNPSNIIEVSVKTEFTDANCYLDRISRDGLTLNCDAQTLHRIMPNKANVAPNNPIILTTDFSLSKKIQAKCRVVFARRLSKNQFIMELKFIDIDDGAMQHLDEYIEKNLNVSVNEKQNTPEKPINKLHALASDVFHINKELKLTYSKVA